MFGMKTGMVEIACRAPQIFGQLAAYYHVEPQRLADALIYSFCCAPPRELILIEHAAAREEPTAFQPSES